MSLSQISIICNEQPWQQYLWYISKQIEHKGMILQLDISWHDNIARYENETVVLMQYQNIGTIQQ